MTVTTTPATIVDQSPYTVGTWMQQYGGGFWRDGVACIGLEREGRLVAGAMFDNYNGASILAHIVIQGPITREWLYRICHYPFIQLGCKVIIGVVAPDNHASQRFVQHFGFHLACAIPEADPAGSLLIYTLSRADCRFLRRRHHG